MKRGKSQYSVEFLVTYGWALLIIGIVIGAIYTFGWFDPGELLPQKCEFYGQIGCRDFFLDEEDFSLSLVNNFGANLNIGRITMKVDNDENAVCEVYFDNRGTTADEIEWTRNDFSIVNVDLNSDDCSEEIENFIREDSRVKLTTTIDYYSPSTCSACISGVDESDCADCLHTSVGRLNIRVS